jgi:hypothetical protein
MVKAGKIGIADVVRDGNSSLPYSVSPTKPKELAVTFALDMVGKTVTFTIEGVNADNGTASLQGTAPITLTQSGTITVQGGTGEQQTKSGNDKQLYVKATCDGKEVGRNTGFSVCAHPVSTRKGPGYDMVNDGTWAGMRISLAFDPDSGTAEHLDEVRVSEQIDPTHYEVFGSFRGIPFAPRTSSFKTVADSNADELFAQPSQIINICTTHGGSGGYTNHQNFIFYCRRCGMTADKAVVIPNSGYKNAFEIQKGAGTRIDFKVTSRPAAVTVNDYSAQAGPSEGKADAVRIRD